MSNLRACVPEEGTESPGTEVTDGYSTRLVQGTEPGSSARAVSMFNTAPLPMTQSTFLIVSISSTQLCCILEPNTPEAPKKNPFIFLVFLLVLHTPPPKKNSLSFTVTFVL